MKNAVFVVLLGFCLICASCSPQPGAEQYIDYIDRSDDGMAAIVYTDEYAALNGEEREQADIEIMEYINTLSEEQWQEYDKKRDEAKKELEEKFGYLNLE